MEQWAFFGWQFDDCTRASVETVNRQRILPGDHQNFSQRVFSTTALIVALLHWGRDLRKLQKQEAAKGILAEFLRVTFGLAELDFALSDAMLADAQGEACSGARHPDGLRCSCLAGLAGFTGAAQKFSHRDVAQLTAAWAAIPKCERIAAWLSHALEQVAELIDCRVVGQHAGSTRLEDYLLERGHKRARRLDPAFGDLLAEGVREKRFRSMASMLRGLDLDVGVSLGRACESQSMLPYYWSTSAIVGRAVQLSIAFDGSRLGGEDTCLFCFWSHADQLGGWLVPQVCRVRFAPRCNDTVHCCLVFGNLHRKSGCVMGV